MSEASPTRIVADADVLAVDLLCGEATDARGALDEIRRHSWLQLVASEPLLEDAEAVIEALSDASLASDWRKRIERECELVDHPEGDNPALASAYRGGAAHLLTYDESLQGTATGLALKPHVQLSIRPPDAFVTLFDAAALYETVEGGTYSGPDRDPRS